MLEAIDVLKGVSVAFFTYNSIILIDHLCSSGSCL